MQMSLGPLICAVVAEAWSPLKPAVPVPAMVTVILGICAFAEAHKKTNKKASNVCISFLIKYGFS
jgi:hypothetical protein